MKATDTKHICAAACVAALALATACVSQKQAPKPVQVTPTAKVSITPAAPKPATKPTPQVDWKDAPITPGTWSWSMEAGKSVARFGGMALALTCNRDAGTITLQRSGSSTEPSVPVTIITSFFNRTLSAEPQAISAVASAPILTISLPARDPLLDAMAFSRGRFAIETAGLPTLYLPSWPEISRVVEDCR